MNSIESIYRDIENVWAGHWLSQILSACPFRTMSEQEMITEAALVASVIRRSDQRLESVDSSRWHIARLDAERIFGFAPEAASKVVSDIHRSLILVATSTLYHNSDPRRRAQLHWAA
jgi:hypothetical protein